MRHTLVLILVVGLSFIALNARAQWQADGVPISTAASDQEDPMIVSIVSDGAGGVFVAWHARGGAYTPDIYAQWVNALGVPQWTVDGVALCVAAGEQSWPTIIPDGAGGAIVTWNDHRNGGGSGDEDIYAQRVNALGVPQWTTDGVALCTAANDQGGPTMLSDGAGGAIVTWSDYRNGITYTNSDIYAQRVNDAGVPQWTADGIALCSAANSQYSYSIVSDGAGGAIVAWPDYRNGGGSGDEDIYAQRVNASGVSQWTVDGVALCTAGNDQGGPTIVSDGAGGAIVTWSDERTGYGNSSLSNIFAQRVNASGVPQWLADGVVLCTAANYQQGPRIVSDGAGGAIVTWADRRSDPDDDVYIQRVNAAGVVQWTTDGVAVCTAPSYQQSPRIVADGAGGAIVTWDDTRTGVLNYDIYAQRVNASGAPQWTINGVPFCTAANSQLYPTIASDGAGGAIVAWSDGRSGTNWDVYAQHVMDPPNAVAIASFDASEANGVVTLRSAFRSDLGVEAVNVYRAVGNDDARLMMIQRVDDVSGDRFEYMDRDVAPGQSYRYRIGVVDGDGEFLSPVVTVSVKAIKTALSQNQPNPFNPTTTIRFVLPVREEVTLAIYDTNGHLVRTLVNGIESYGAHEVTWDGRDNNGAAMGSGVYFYRLHSGKHTESKKMVLLK